MQKASQKLHVLRDRMKTNNLNAFIIPMTDPHISEYVPDYWRVIQWFSGFSGSAGTLVVTSDFAGLWTDSRYFIQAADQLNGTGIELVKLTIPHASEYMDWLKEHIPSGGVIGYDGKVYSVGLTRMLKDKLSAKQIKLNSSADLLSDMWEDRPEFPSSKLFEHELRFAGKSRTGKIEQIRDLMRKEQVEFHLLSSLDDVAWTFNIRGSDVKYSPLVVAYGLIGLKHAWLFVDQKKISSGLQKTLEQDGIEIRPYEEVCYPDIIGISDRKVFLSPGSANTGLFNSWNGANEIVEGLSMPTRMKAIKNSLEINHIRKVMIKDGVALTKFFYWLEMNIEKIEITEVSAARKLEELRAEQENFVSPGFGTIAGYKAHGAIVHYEADKQSDFPLHAEGIFLLDSGGQYYDGTTDITRTISLGNPDQEEKKDFTLVLKGTIQLALTRFPKGTRGYQIEAFARRALWNHGLNYGHGTGHGVGFFLNVHEGPQTIGSAASSGNRDIALEAGMLISDEPGLYREGKYGIRTENLVLVENDKKTEFGEFLKFETVSLCYIDTSLIEISLLGIEEIEWLNTYHGNVYEKIAPCLNGEEKKWLRNKTEPISR